MPVIFLNYPFSSNDLSVLMLEKNQVFKFVLFFFLLKILEQKLLLVSGFQEKDFLENRLYQKTPSVFLIICSTLSFSINRFKLGNIVYLSFKDST